MKSDWITIRAADFIEFNPRLSIKKGATATKVSMDRLQPFTKKILSTEQTEFTGGAKFCNGDTLMARITPCLENGKTAFVDILNDGEIGFGSTEFIVMRARKGISNPQFIYYMATSPFFRDIAIKSMVGSSGRQRVQQSVLDNLELYVPDLEEQERIGSFLAKLDDKLALNSAINNNLEQQAQAIYQSLFVYFDGISANQLTRSELGPIPVGWMVKSLSEITTSMRTKAKGNDYKVLSAINTGQLQLSEEYFTKQVFSKSISNYIVVEPFDFAYNPARINIGSIGMNTFGFTGCVSPIYVVIRCEPEYHYFLDFFIKSKRFSEEVKTRASGSVRQSLNYTDFGQIKIACPPIDVIERFNREYEVRLKTIEHLKGENKRLSSIRDTLLPKLMSGEIDVSAIQL